MEVTAILLGLTASLHCVGMCSPLVMAVSSSSPQAVKSRLVYNSGRIFTYSMLGALFSTVGVLLPIARYQYALSIAFGVVLLIIALLRIDRFNIPWITPVLLRFSSFLKNQFSGALRKKRMSSTFVLGTINGLLPCGMSFIALTYTILLQRPVDGMMFMMLFGIGTLPVMLGLTSVLAMLMQKLSLNFSRLSTVFMLISGVLLIARTFLHVGSMTHSVSEAAEIILCL